MTAKKSPIVRTLSILQMMFRRRRRSKSRSARPSFLKGIVFKSGSADHSSESADFLEQAYNTLARNPEIEVQINGCTDNVGKRELNMSQSRADAVKAFLVKNGIDASRIGTKGYGPDNPVGDNSTVKDGVRTGALNFCAQNNTFRTCPSALGDWLPLICCPCRNPQADGAALKNTPATSGRTHDPDRRRDG